MTSIPNLYGIVHQSYFELLSTIINKSYNKMEIIVILLEKMGEFLNPSSADAYYYDEFKNTYQRINADSNLNSKLEPKFILSEDVFKYKKNDVKITFPFTVDQEKYLYVFTFTNRKLPSEEHIEFVKKETESLLNLIQKFRVKKRSKWYYQELFELSKRIFATYDMNTILKEISDSLERNYSEIGYTFFLSQDTEVSPSLPVKSIEYTNIESENLSTKAFQTGELQFESKPEINTSYIYAPLTGKQGIYGVLEINVPLNTSLPKMGKQFLIEFAQMVGKAIEAATLFQNSKHQVSDLTIINDTSHQLNSNLELREIVSLLKEQIRSTCHAADVGFIKFYDEYEILSGSSAFFHTGDSMLFMEYLYKKTKAYKEPLFIGNFSDGEMLLPYSSVMAFPMVQAGKVLGLTVILHRDSYHFSFDQFKLMQAIIQHSALAMANTILKDKLKEAVIKDYLTGLYSRNYLEETIERHMREGESGILILLDIDDFKKINDSFGHHVGDQVLIQVSNTLMNNIGPGNIAARWGGEEIAIYAPNMKMEEGYILAEAISMQVELTTDPTVTLSSGVSAWNKEMEGDQDMRTLFLRTDKALYEAKNNGKNQVIKN
ncbi:sensor domain-containing diguanylate cyclase [Oceanobacillus sp. CF4.6]|uniref:sensor domain-containing diguanylate cyclase n=1 Tax=Oceanobacillus sp. CF4.6 TaxID=3373080 RepID=UPI003EE71C93